jgi:hypothetical protein
MTTANQIIGMAFGNLGLRALGQTIDGDYAIVALEKLNSLLDFIPLSDQIAASSNDLTATLPSGATTLLVGPSQALNTPIRPVRFLDGCTVRTGSYDYPLQEITSAEYENIALKNMGGFIPECFAYNASSPNGVLSFYPPPSGNVTINMLVDANVGQFIDLVTEYSLPVGMKEVLHLQLAVAIAPDFEREVPPSIAARAAHSLRMFKNANLEPKQIEFGSPDRLTARRLFGL